MQIMEIPLLIIWTTRARDYRGGNITDKVKVYGKVDINQKGVYRLRCTVISYFNLACTKYINIIVE